MKLLVDSSDEDVAAAAQQDEKVRRALEIAIQLNGKLRSTVQLPADSTD